MSLTACKESIHHFKIPSDGDPFEPSRPRNNECKESNDALIVCQSSSSVSNIPEHVIFSHIPNESERYSSNGKLSFSSSISLYKGKNNYEQHGDIASPYPSMLLPLLCDKPTLAVPRYPLIGPQRSQDEGKKTLVLDLDETLIHSSFYPSCYDFAIMVSFAGRKVPIYVSERPGVRDFLAQMNSLFELVVFTASSSDYANQILDVLDSTNCIASRLTREHCIFREGGFIKDLSLLGRNLESVVLIDNTSNSFLLQPQNGIECSPYFKDSDDKEFQNIIPFLQYLAKKDDVRKYTKLWSKTKHLR